MSKFIASFVTLVGLTASIASAHLNPFFYFNSRASQHVSVATTTITVTASKPSASPKPVPTPPTTKPVTSKPATTTVIVHAPIIVQPPVATSTVTSSHTLQWGVYVGDGSTALADFQNEVGKQADIQAVFNAFGDDFPSYTSATVGAQGKTLLVFWEPSTGYNQIINGSQDAAIKNFAAGAKSYGYPVILAPFDEMNLNENAWGYGVNGNTAATFVSAWKHIHDIFVAAGATNVKFALTYNADSEPNVSGNQYSDYYPGSAYVDYIGLDGFNFGNPPQTFGEIFDPAIAMATPFGKPIYILSVGSIPSAQKAAWITDAFGSHIKTYPNVVGWVWFNQNDSSVADAGDQIDWKIDSDAASLAAFKTIIP